MLFRSDAFQYMIDHGAKIKVVDVAGWYDAGKLDTLLETNSTMLEKGRASLPTRGLKNVEVIYPVRIEDGAIVTDCILGPNVVIGAGSTVTSCTLRDAIVGERTTLLSCILTDSMIGDQAHLEGITGSATLGDHAEVHAPRS